MGITPSQLTPVTAANFNLIPQGSDYFPQGAYLENQSTNEISQYSGGEFHLVSWPVANKIGLNGSNVITITAEQYDKVSKGNDYFPEGMLLQNAQNDEVAIYSGGQRHMISVPVKNAMNITPPQLTTISASQFNEIPQGSDYFPQGAFLENQATSEISQYSGGIDHVVSVPVATVMAAMGLPTSQVISVTSAQYDAIPQGSPYYPQGIFIENSQTNEIDQFSNGERYWVTTLAQLEIGLMPSQIATIGANDFNAIPFGGTYVPPATTTSSSPG